VSIAKLGRRLARRVQLLILGALLQPLLLVLSVPLSWSTTTLSPYLLLDLDDMALV
jgi:hypothetical protein